MASQDKATLKSAFETGDGPTGTDFANLIDSQLNLAETTAQTISGAVTFAGGVTFSAVSAATVGGATGTFSILNATAATIVTLTATDLFGLARAECFAVSNGVVAVTALNSYVQAQVGTSSDVALSQFTHNGSGRLTYTGLTNKVIQVEVDFTITPVTVTQIVEVRLGKNGASLAKSGIQLRMSTNSAEFAGHIGAMVMMTANSYIEPMISPTLNISNVTFTKMTMRAREV